MMYMHYASINIWTKKGFLEGPFNATFKTLKNLMGGQ